MECSPPLCTLLSPYFDYVRIKYRYMENVKILVVDDEPDILEFIKYNLAKEGYEVFTASDGEEGLEVANQQQPDLIVLDIMMPKMDGVELCRALRNDRKFDQTLIAFLTARDEDYSQIAALDVGGDDYITKPIDLDGTLARVRTQLRLQEMFRENLDLQERLGDARKAAAVGAITQGIAHNLNNLLGVVVGYLDLIKNGYDSADMVKRSVGLMDHAINRMVIIIRQLGTIANNERYEMTLLQIDKLLRNSIQRFQSEYNVEAVVSVESDLETTAAINANAETFEIILGKLLINAWESYPKKTPIEERKIALTAGINRERGPAKLEIKVADEGCGIPASIKDTLFEPFITTKTAVGRGMGLTISRHTMRNINGDVQVRNNDGDGVTATLTHPLS